MLWKECWCIMAWNLWHVDDMNWLSYIEGFSQRIDDFVSKYFFDHIFQHWSAFHWQILTVSLNLEHVTSPVSWACLEKRLLLYVSIYIFWHFLLFFFIKFVFLSSSFIYLMKSNSHNKLLLIRNYPWNCMLGICNFYKAQLSKIATVLRYLFGRFIWISFNYF